jgi:hypothetical protein
VKISTVCRARSPSPARSTGHATIITQLVPLAGFNATYWFLDAQRDQVLPQGKKN